MADNSVVKRQVGTLRYNDEVVVDCGPGELGELSNYLDKRIDAENTISSYNEFTNSSTFFELEDGPQIGFNVDRQRGVTFVLCFNASWEPRGQSDERLGHIMPGRLSICNINLSSRNKVKPCQPFLLPVNR